MNALTIDPARASPAEFAAEMYRLSQGLLAAPGAHYAAGYALDFMELTKGIKGKRAIEIDAALHALGPGKAAEITAAIRAGHAALELVSYRPEGTSIH